MVRTLSPERRTQFLGAALKLFARNGVQHTSTADIARAAGTAAGTLFLYFPTKQALLHELVLQVSREQSAAVNALLSPALSARETFQAIWNGSLQWFLANMDAYRYVQQVRDSGLISEAAVEESGQHLAYYYAAVQKGLAEGAIKPYPLELTGAILYQDIVAVMNLAAAQPDANAREVLIAAGFEIFWDGIKAGQPSVAGRL